MGAIKERMRGDMVLRGYSKHTIREYLRSARRFVAHFGKSPDRLGATEVRAYLVHRADTGASQSAQKMDVAAIRFLYAVTLGQPEVVSEFGWPKVESRLPEVLAGSEVGRLLEAVRSLKLRVALGALYAGGLRVHEACCLGVGDIDSVRMVMRVVEGKGRKERWVPLAQRLLEELREYWRRARPPGPYLFPGRSGEGHVCPTTLQRAIRRAAAEAGLSKRVTPHVLRHSYATHQLECGLGIRELQVLLGHGSIQTTTRYLHVSRRHLARLPSPLDLLGTKEGEVLD